MSMRRPIGIAVGTAALTGVAVASMAVASRSAEPSMVLVTPAASVGAGGDLLGPPSASTPTPGIAPGWLLLRVVPEPAAAPAAPAAPAPIVAAPSPQLPRVHAPSGTPVSCAGTCLRVPGVITVHLPVQLPTPLRVLQRLPLLSLPPAASAPAPAPAPPTSTHGGNKSGSGHHQSQSSGKGQATADNSGNQSGDD
jgi:hypothetical protein